MKTCRKCKEEKPLSDFYKANRGIGGVRGDCKKCVYERSKNRLKSAPDTKIAIADYQKVYANKNKEARRQYMKEYREKNSESLKTQKAKRYRSLKTTGVPIPATKVCSMCGEEKPNNSFQKWSGSTDGLSSNCKPCKAAYRQSKYHDSLDDNREKARLYSQRTDVKKRRSDWNKANRHKKNEWVAYKYKTDEQYRITCLLRSRLSDAVKRAKAQKHFKTLELIGCDIPTLLSHLESKFTKGMNWNNRSEWHIDHIIPCAAFDLTDPIQQKQCFHYTNLQPLWAFENISKHAKIEQPIQMAIPL